MSADALRWNCVRCKVSVGRIDGGPAKLPASWSRSDGRVLCLGCSRANVEEVAMESAPVTCSRGERRQLGRTALIEFEIGRAPQAPDRKIALVCHTSSAAVAAVRKRVSATPKACG